MVAGVISISLNPLDSESKKEISLPSMVSLPSIWSLLDKLLFFIFSTTGLKSDLLNNLPLEGFLFTFLKLPLGFSM